MLGFLVIRSILTLGTVVAAEHVPGGRVLPWCACPHEVSDVHSFHRHPLLSCHRFLQSGSKERISRDGALFPSFCSKQKSSQQSTWITTMCEFCQPGAATVSLPLLAPLPPAPRDCFRDAMSS